MKKRMICLLLTIVMLVGLLPVTGLAATVTNITVTNPEYYDSGALKSITANFNWGTNPPKGRLVLATKYLRSEGSNGYTYGDFTDRGYYADNFNFTSFDAVLAHDQANRDLGLITYTDEKSISYSNNTMTLSFAEGHIPLSKNGTYYVYFWTYYRGEYYPDNLIMAIEVNNGGVSYTVANSSEGRNALSSTSNQVTSSNTYDVIITAAENMTKTEDSGAAMQSNLNSAMTPVVFTANDGYTFPENYAVNTTNGIMVSRDNAEQITVYGTPTSNTTITLPAPTSTGYRVSFDANGGTGTVPTQDATAQGGTFTIPDADGLTKDGYTFSGWNDGEKTYAAGDTYTMPAKNVTFTANWEETVARYDLWVGGVQVASDNLVIDSADNAAIEGSATYNPETCTLTLNGFSYTGQGYVYDSPWCAAIFSKNDLTIEVVGSNTVTASVTGNYTAEALNVWGALTITGDSGSSLTLTGAGRDGVGSGGNLKIENVTVNATGTSGLYSDEGDITINNAEVTATATTDQMQYAAAIYAYEGNITIENSTVTANAPYANAVYSYKSELRYTIKNSNVTISAAEYGIGLTVWTRLFVENSTVEVTSDAGLAIVNDQNNFGAVPRFTGTHVVYAGDDAGSATEADASADATYANKYVKIVPAYTVTYKADGKVVDTVEVEHGKDAAAPEIPAKAGHTALWDKDGKNITADTEINAVYTINKYTVTYKADGKVVKTVEVEHGKDATAPEIPAKVGHTALWDEDGKNITADTTINAVYTKNQPGTFTSITPTTNAGGGKLTDKVHELKEKIPFTQEEALQIEYGADVEVWLEVKDISASVPADDKKEIEKKLGDGNVAMYLDIAMFKQVGENEASRLTQLSDKVQITFELPDSYINTDKDVTRTYSIIHVHDGKAEVITPVFDAATKTLTFETDRFSTYGVVYTDEKITPPAEETVPPAQETTAPTEATKPASKVPETGDSFQPAFWIACMTLSIFGIAVLLLDAKRRHAR